MYNHRNRGMRCLVHGGDFVRVGSPEDLEWMKEKLQKRFEIRTTTVGTSEEEGEVKEARILNRIIRATDNGSGYEADHRQSDLIVEETGAEKRSAPTHPGVEKQTMEESVIGLIGLAQFMSFFWLPAFLLNSQRQKVDPVTH